MLWGLPMSDCFPFRPSRRALLTAFGATAAGCMGAPRQVPSVAAQTDRALPPATDPRAARLDAALERAHRAGTFDGVMVAAEGGRPFYERGFGLADRGAKAPNGPETRFPLASITKQLTALLVLQFVDEGRLDLDAPVERVLPGFRGGRPEGINARQLLMHTSGLPDPDAVPGFLTERDPSKLRPEAVLAGPLAGPLLSAPGVQFRYNNGDYWVLGALCERLGGAPFAALLARRILGPLGMTSAGLFVDDAPVAGVAKSYERGAAGPAETIRLANLYAAGALYGTARDVLRWDEALRSHRLLSKRATDVMFTADKSKGFVALGSWVYEHKFPRAAAAPLLIERQGEVGAFRHLNVIAPREETVVIVLSNGGEPELFKLYADQGLSFELLTLVFDDAARRGAPLRRPPRLACAAPEPTNTRRPGRSSLRVCSALQHFEA